MNSPAKREIFLQESTNEDLDKTVDSKFEKIKVVKLAPASKQALMSEVSSNIGDDKDQEEFKIGDTKPILEISSESSSYVSSRSNSIADRAEREMDMEGKTLNT